MEDDQRAHSFSDLPPLFSWKTVSPAELFPTGPVFRRLEQFVTSTIAAERVLRVSGARVVYANRNLLIHDFPELSHPSHFKPKTSGDHETGAANRVLEDWLCENAAFISEPQAGPNTVNTRVQLGLGSATAFRLPGYGRAAVVPVGQPFQEAASSRIEPRKTRASEPLVGFLDLKGIGVPPGRSPGHGYHLTGLLEVGEAIRELIFQQLLAAVFKHAGARFEVVPIYAILDLGFGVKLETGDGISPAGLLVRRAHARPLYPWGLAELGSPLELAELEIELLLRRYGITSVGLNTTIQISDDAGSLVVKFGQLAHSYFEAELEVIKNRAGYTEGTQFIEGINVEFGRGEEDDHPQVVDFGAYRVKKCFEHPLCTLVAHNLLRLGQVIHPSDPRFAQPDSAIRVPFDTWGNTDSPTQNGRSEAPAADRYSKDKPRSLAFSLATGFREGKVSSEQVKEITDNYVRTAISRW